MEPRRVRAEWQFALASHGEPSCSPQLYRPASSCAPSNGGVAPRNAPLNQGLCYDFQFDFDRPAGLAMLSTLIRDYLIQNAKVEPALFEQPDLKVADLALDSLGLVEMLFEIEDRCGFQIEDPMRFREMGFAEMVASIENEIRAHHGGEMPDLSSMGLTAGQA